MVGRVVGGRGCEILAVWRGGLDWESRNVRYGMGGDLCRSADQYDMVSNRVPNSAPVLPGLCPYPQNNANTKLCCAGTGFWDSLSPIPRGSRASVRPLAKI